MASKFNAREDTIALSNELQITLGEFSTTSGIRQGTLISPIVPECMERWLPDLQEYLPEGARDDGTTDLRIIECARTLRFGCWLHRADMHHTHRRDQAHSLDLEDHDQGPLTAWLLITENTGIMFHDIAQQVISENREALKLETADAANDLRAAKRCRDELRKELESLRDKLDHTPKWNKQGRAKLNSLIKAKSRKIDRNAAHVTYCDSLLHNRQEEFNQATAPQPTRPLPDYDDDGEDNPQAQVTQGGGAGAPEQEEDMDLKVQEDIEDDDTGDNDPPQDEDPHSRESGTFSPINPEEVALLEGQEGNPTSLAGGVARLSVSTPDPQVSQQEVEDREG